jgi:phosphoribosylanthranilate isomerase
MVKVKICGITNIEDARMAVSLGADALGFNFYRKSPRYIEPAKAKAIIEALPPFISLVAIFVDEYSPERVVRMTHAVGIGTVQLHGSESPAYAKHLSELRLIKAFRVNEHFDPGEMTAYPASAFLLDAFEPGIPGGTGKGFNWDQAIEAKKYGRIILAGGLTAENVKEAICKVEPYAVDVCSGVEIDPGKKDLKRMEAFFAEVRRAYAELAKAKSSSTL